jgi:hypothetical protein
MRKITVKLNDSDFRKLKSLKGDEPISTYIRKLIQNEHGRAEESISMTAEFLEKIKNADLVKMSESIRRLEEKLEDQIDMEKIMRYLNRILTESAKARIEIEEYARRDFPPEPFKLFSSDVKVQFKSYVESWNKQKGGE